MPETVATERTYNGLYRHSVDDKRRVPIPFRWRPEEPIEFTISLWPKHQVGSCLRVLPPEQWTKLRQVIENMADSDPQKELLKRRIGTTSAQAKLDSAGRLTIPENMAVAAGLENQAVLAGFLDRFEIWKPERYDALEALENRLLPEGLRLMQ